MTVRYAYAEAEKPELQYYDFDDSAGAAVDLTGFTAALKWRDSAGVEQTQSATVSIPATDGRVEWLWPDAMFTTVGRYSAQIVVTQTGGDLRVYKSDGFVVAVRRFV